MGEAVTGSPEEVRISVIIPAYNMAAYLSRSVGSALEQDRPAHEVILSDDGSNDDTAAVAAEWAGRVRYVRQPRNRGVSVARNAGANIATGNWLLFLDSDDRLEPGALGRLAETARRSHAGVVFGRVEELNEDTGARRNRVNTACAGDPPVPALHNFWRAALPTPGCAIVRRDLHNAIGGFEKPWQPTEDRDYWLKCGVTMPFEFCDAPVIEKLRRETSSRLNSNIALFWGLRVQFEFLEWCRARKIDTAFITASRSEMAARALRAALTARAGVTIREIVRYCGEQGVRIPVASRLRLLFWHLRGAQGESEVKAAASLTAATRGR